MADTVHRAQGSPLFLSTSNIKNFYILAGGCMDGAPQPFNEFFKEDKHPWIPDVAAKARL